jgi:hypothetical protein
MFALFRINDKNKQRKRRSQSIQFYQTQPLLIDQKGRQYSQIFCEMAEGQHQSARKTYSSPSGILKKEFEQLDRQYSYEHTVVSQK